MFASNILNVLGNNSPCLIAMSISMAMFSLTLIWTRLLQCEWWQKRLFFEQSDGRRNYFLSRVTANILNKWNHLFCFVIGLRRSGLTMVCTSYGSGLEQALLWLNSPMREWQSRSHRSHMYVLVGLSVLLCCFLRVLLSSAASDSFFSPVMRCWCMVFLHLVRSDARVSQDVMLMSRAFMSLLQTSL